MQHRWFTAHYTKENKGKYYTYCMRQKETANILTYASKLLIIQGRSRSNFYPRHLSPRLVLFLYSSLLFYKLLKLFLSRIHFSTSEWQGNSHEQNARNAVIAMVPGHGWNRKSLKWLFRSVFLRACFLCAFSLCRVTPVFFLSSPFWFRVCFAHLYSVNMCLRFLHNKYFG